jgi:hypothetical protein
MASEGDPWITALALEAAVELKLNILAKDIKKFRKHTHPLVKETAEKALQQLQQEEKMSKKTLQTLTTIDRVILLREVPLFKQLSVEDLKQIADLAHEQLFQKGDLLVKQGDDGDQLYIIVDGEVEVRVATEHGETVVATHSQSGFLGEMAILETAPRSASAYALEETRTLVISGASFKAILKDRPEVSLAVLAGLSHRVRELNAKLR